MAAQRYLFLGRSRAMQTAGPEEWPANLAANCSKLAVIAERGSELAKGSTATNAGAGLPLKRSELAIIIEAVRRIPTVTAAKVRGSVKFTAKSTKVANSMIAVSAVLKFGGRAENCRLLIVASAGRSSAGFAERIVEFMGKD